MRENSAPVTVRATSKGQIIAREETRCTERCNARSAEDGEHGTKAVNRGSQHSTPASDSVHESLRFSNAEGENLQTSAAANRAMFPCLTGRSDILRKEDASAAFQFIHCSAVLP